MEDVVQHSEKVSIKIDAIDARPGTKRHSPRSDSYSGAEDELGRELKKRKKLKRGVRAMLLQKSMEKKQISPEFAQVNRH